MENFLIFFAVLAAFLILIWLRTSLWFFAAMRVRQMQKDGTFNQLSADIRWGVLIPGYLGLILDALYNWTFGILFFLEFPREFLFSNRVKRWNTKFDKSAGDQSKWRNRWRFMHARRFKHDLNLIDSDGHI